jgi:serine/threonine-protein kinase
VHRDLKPANIKLRSDGTVRCSTSGLAKAMDLVGSSASNPNVSHSPTLAYRDAGRADPGTAAAVAGAGEGKAVDRRADIWAFGVVLYGY